MSTFFCAFPGLQARGWYQAIRESLARYDGSGQHPVIADEESPQEIVPTFDDRYSRLSEILPLFAKVQVDGPMDGPLLSISSNGVMQPARFRAQSTSTLTQLLHAGGITSFARSSGPSCLLPSRLGRRRDRRSRFGDDSCSYFRSRDRVHRRRLHITDPLLRRALHRWRRRLHTAIADQVRRRNW